ncbi:phage portal protein [Escherichia coli]|nr:phage portal protein [Escherichia coli]
MKRTPVLIDVNGVPLRESLSYNGGGAGFGGQMAEWLPPAQSADAALLPALRLGNARADDLVRNNGIAANAVALHKDHIVGHMFLISYRPNWRWLGMRETATKSFVDEVEAAWSEYAEGVFGEIDVEGKRTFTEFIREGVGVHAFNGEIFVQPVWDPESTQLFRTRFKAVSPKRVDTPGHGIGNRFLRAGVEVDRYGRAVAYHICEDDFPFSGSGRWERIPRELPTGRPAMLHIFEPVEDGQTRGANQFYSVMERLKMLDSLQATQLQSAIVKAMYAATIESDLDTEKAFEYIAGAPQGQKDNPLINILDKFSTWYDTNSVTLGGVKIPHLFPGDDLKLQTAQDSDNGFSALEQALLRYIAAGLGVSYEQLSRDYSKVSYSSARASANESWRYFMGRRKFIASRLATQMFSCWLEAAVQENQRVMGILTCQEAKGREQLATMLAGQQGMSVEQARAILAAAAPQQPVASAQSEADRIMACEEANGREQLAATLAAMPEMTVEKARPILAAAPLADAGPSLRDQIMALDEAKGAEAQAEKLAACPGMTVENARAVLAAGSGKAEPVSASTTALFEHFMANHSPAAVRGGVSQTSADGDADVKMLMAMP